MQKIHVSIVDGKSALCFDTGLDPRSFARTKMSQSLVEPGYIVHIDGSHEVWKSTGVKDLNNNMRVWGSPVTGKRLDQVIEKENSDTALQAVAFWIRAKMLLSEPRSALNPGAAFVCCEDSEQKGCVFFAPQNLANRCLLIEGVVDHYNCPDLSGMDAAAFCAGTMLYRILTNIHPYENTADIFQDMREGVFLPPQLAAPGLDKKLCELIQEALLLPVEHKKTGKSGINILGDMLNLLMGKENMVFPILTLFSQKTKEEKVKIEKEKKLHLFKQNTAVKTRRFVIRNKFALIGVSAGLLFALIIVFSTAKNYSHRQTTEGLISDTVVMAYYDAFSRLDHVFMDAIIQGADKTDITAATNLFAVMKTRQYYESGASPSIVPARLWLELGGELPNEIAFGVTDLVIKHRDGSEDENMIVYQADYLLWTPIDNYAFGRSDILILRRDKKKNWRITEILRTEK